MDTLNVITRVLVIIGALNWGLVGLFEFDLVAAIAGTRFGDVTAFSRIVYVLVALSGIYQLFTIGNRDRVMVAERRVP